MFQFKLVLLGDSAVGKSSLVLRFVRGQFFEYQESTIGAAFLTQTVALNDTTVKFEIWDTAGQERYHSLAPMYYRGAAAAIVVYDITNRVRTPLASPASCPPPKWRVLYLETNRRSRSSRALPCTAGGTAGGGHGRGGGRAYTEPRPEQHAVVPRNGTSVHAVRGAALTTGATVGSTAVSMYVIDSAARPDAIQGTWNVANGAGAFEQAAGASALCSGGNCSAACDGGTQERARVVTVQATAGGAACPALKCAAAVRAQPTCACPSSRLPSAS